MKMRSTLNGHLFKISVPNGFENGWHTHKRARTGLDCWKLVKKHVSSIATLKSASDLEESVRIWTFVDKAQWLARVTIPTIQGTDNPALDWTRDDIKCKVKWIPWVSCVRINFQSLKYSRMSWELRNSSWPLVAGLVSKRGQNGLYTWLPARWKLRRGSMRRPSRNPNSNSATGESWSVLTSR